MIKAVIAPRFQEGVVVQICGVGEGCGQGVGMGVVVDNAAGVQDKTRTMPICSNDKTLIQPLY